jgi:hypothetical protein
MPEEFFTEKIMQLFFQDPGLPGRWYPVSAATFFPERTVFYRNITKNQFTNRKIGVIIIM